MRQILIDESIEHRELVYKRNWGLVGAYATNVFMGVLSPLVFFLWSIFDPHTFRSAGGIDKFFLGIVCWTLLSYYFSTKLALVRVENAIQKRAAIQDIAQGKYPEVKFTPGVPMLLRGQKPDGWSGRGKVVSILLKGDYLYINIQSTFRGGNFDVIFCGLINYLRSKSLAKEIQAANL